MADRPTMMNPPIEDLLDRVDSKFTLVTLAARRGRQINTYFNSLGDGLGAIVPPQVASLARKPLSIALEEVAAGKIGFLRPEEAEGDDGDVGGGDEPLGPGDGPGGPSALLGHTDDHSPE
ncbi:MAG: DNA-directed RNA polymerase subunit omega [Acidimicrobiales bacterium]